MSSLKKIKLVALLLLIGQLLYSGVNLKNGNFYISYTDVMVAKSYGAIDEISRTYNSKSTQVGLFGYGWGTVFESHLYTYPDGSIVIAEYGAGGKTPFTTPFSTQDMLDLMIDQLIQTAVDQGDLDNSPNAILKKREVLSDQEQRIALWNKYVNKGLLEYTSTLPAGAEWESFERGRERILKTESGYTRIKSSKIEEFNLDGQLVKIDEKNGQYSTLEYVDGKLSKIINADNTFVEFTLNQDGFITQIDHNGKSAKFRYEGQNLVFAEDVAGNKYEHSYDVNHNMVKILYNPVRFKGEAEDAMLMEYEPKTGFLSKITDRNGESTTYTYKKYFKEDGSIDDDHYSTQVTKKDYVGNLQTNDYEYFIGTKEDGNTFTKQINTTINGITTSTVYDELCGVPISIKRGNNETTFKYNNRCLLLEKITPYDSITMQYHPNFEKMTYVKNSSGEYRFEYDEKANLTYITKNEDSWTRLEYDEHSKITRMTQEDRTLDFTYNDLGKPSKILLKTEDTTGSINVTYDEYGEILSVKSDDGSSMALEVTQAFQELLNLVKPAGVNLNM